VWGGGRVVLGDRVLLNGRACGIELHALRGAAIHVGDDVQIEAGTSVEATGLIIIGARSHLGRFCKLMDNQFHATRGNHAITPAAGGLHVGCDVEIGPHAVLLPGAAIDDGCVVEPCRVVSRRVASCRAAPEPGHGI
jgi:acetyltransferase-like isoleucine patch superfamily enzyme